MRKVDFPISKMYKDVFRLIRVCHRISENIFTWFSQSVKWWKHISFAKVYSRKLGFHVIISNFWFGSCECVRMRFVCGCCYRIKLSHTFRFRMSTWWLVYLLWFLHIPKRCVIDTLSHILVFFFPVEVVWGTTTSHQTSIKMVVFQVQLYQNKMGKKMFTRKCVLWHQLSALSTRTQTFHSSIVLMLCGTYVYIHHSECFRRNNFFFILFSSFTWPFQVFRLLTRRASFK